MILKPDLKYGLYNINNILVDLSILYQNKQDPQYELINRIMIKYNNKIWKDDNYYYNSYTYFRYLCEKLIFLTTIIKICSEKCYEKDLELFRKLKRIYMEKEKQLLDYIKTTFKESYNEFDKILSNFLSTGLALYYYNKLKSKS